MDRGICEKRLRATLDKFGGVLKAGKHTAESGEVCGLELLAEDMGLGHTDSPVDTHTWDLRRLNDMNVPDDVRTEHLLPVLAAYAGSADWSLERQREVSERILLEIFRKVISKYVPANLRDEWLAVSSIMDAQKACNNLAHDLALDHALDLAIFTAVCAIYMEAIT